MAARWSAGTALRIAAGFGFAGVALGAFGAHALQKALIQRGTAATWETAVLYHLVHAVVLLVVAGLRPFPRLAWTFFAVGVLAFSGSLYLYALSRWFPLVFVTPLGGLCLLLGWLLLVLRRPAEPTL